MCLRVRKLRDRLCEALLDNEGATAVEYAVLLGLMVLVCVSIIRAVGLWSAAVLAELADSISV